MRENEKKIGEKWKSEMGMEKNEKNERKQKNKKQKIKTEEEKGK